jgi:hypothetical protein
MEGGTYPLTHPSLSALEGGWTGSSLPDLPPYPHYPQDIAEARYLILCNALPSYQLTCIFRHIPLVSILCYSLVPSRESTKEVGQHTLKATSPRYEGSLHLLEESEDLYLIQ